jgi:surface antigen
VNNESIRGRHRAPGRHNPLNELKLLARESAQPAMKGAAVVAATGGLVATFANPASADTSSSSNGVVAEAAPAEAAPAAVAPVTTTVAAPSALSAIGFAPAVQTIAQRAAAKPRVIQDVSVVQARAAAAAKARAAAVAARKAAAERASRDLTRRTLTTSTSTTKSTSNTTVARATSGVRASHNWATPGQCTWGALNKWYASEGYYPGGWTGNASSWAYGAASAGYTVSGTPRTRSIIVMQPGVYGSSSLGHVGWVTGVSGNQVTFVEMNALAGAYNYNTRTITDTSGIKYIYAP